MKTFGQGWSRVSLRLAPVELTGHAWTAPMLPKKPRGVPRVNDPRVLYGILWVREDERDNHIPLCAQGPRTRFLRTSTIVTVRSAFGQIETVALELRVEKLTMDA